jgi:hypothetical protein
MRCIDENQYCSPVLEEEPCSLHHIMNYGLEIVARLAGIRKFCFEQILIVLFFSRILDFAIDKRLAHMCCVAHVAAAIIPCQWYSCDVSLNSGLLIVCNPHSLQFGKWHCSTVHMLR